MSAIYDLILLSGEQVENQFEEAWLRDAVDKLALFLPRTKDHKKEQDSRFYSVGCYW